MAHINLMACPNCKKRNRRLAEELVNNQRRIFGDLPPLPNGQELWPQMKTRTKL